MKRYKRLYLLLGVLAVACIATFGVLRFEEHQEQIKNSDEIILKVPSDTVTSLSWEYQEEYLLSQALAEIVGSESATSKAAAGSSAGPFGPVADAPSRLNRVQGAIAGNEARNQTTSKGKQE